MSSSSKINYWVVEFLSDSTVEVVPESWLIEGGKSYWPCNPKLDKKLKTNLVKSDVNPLENPRFLWEVFECGKLISSDDYNKAERAAYRAQERTDVELTESEAELTPVNSRKLRPRSLRYNGDTTALNITSNQTLEDPGLETLQNLFIVEEGPLASGSVLTAPEVTPTELSIDLPNLPPCPSVSSTILLQDLIVPNENCASSSSQLSDEVTGLQRELKEFQRVLLREVEKLKGDVQQILQVVQAKTTGGDSVVVVEIPGIPVDSEEALQTLESWLAEGDNRSKLIIYLRRVGGNDLENFVKRVLGKVVGPNLARQMNFTGKNGKLSFNSLALHSCLKSACRKNPTDTDPTDSQIDCIVKKWFAGSGDRHGGRNERMKRQNQKTAQQDN